FNVRNVYDVKENIRGGLAYLRWLLAYYEGQVALALAAYNAGEAAVDKYRGIPPYPETRDYVRRVRRLFRSESHAFDPRAVAPSPILTEGSAQREQSRCTRVPPPRCIGCICLRGACCAPSRSMPMRRMRLQRLDASKPRLSRSERMKPRAHLRSGSWERGLASAPAPSLPPTRMCCRAQSMRPASSFLAFCTPEAGTKRNFAKPKLSPSIPDPISPCSESAVMPCPH